MKLSEHGGIPGVIQQRQAVYYLGQGTLLSLKSQNIG